MYQAVRCQSQMLRTELPPCWVTLIVTLLLSRRCQKHLIGCNWGHAAADSENRLARNNTSMGSNYSILSRRGRERALDVCRR